MFDDTYTQMASLYQGKCVDPRLAHVVTYAIHSGAAKELLRSLVLEMIIREVSADPPKANLRILAQKEFLSLFGTENNMQANIDVSRLTIDHACNEVITLCNCCLVHGICDCVCRRCGCYTITTSPSVGTSSRQSSTSKKKGDYTVL